MRETIRRPSKHDLYSERYYWMISIRHLTYLLGPCTGSGLTQRFVHNRHQRMNFESTAALMTISATNSYTEENDDIPGLLQ